MLEQQADRYDAHAAYPVQSVRLQRHAGQSGAEGSEPWKVVALALGKDHDRAVFGEHFRHGFERSRISSSIRRIHGADGALVAGSSQWHDADRAQKVCDEWIGEDRRFRSETHATWHGVCHRQRIQRQRPDTD